MIDRLGILDPTQRARLSGLNPGCAQVLAVHQQCLQYDYEHKRQLEAVAEAQENTARSLDRQYGALREQVQLLEVQVHVCEEETRQKEEKEKQKAILGKRPPAVPKPQTAAKVKTKYMLGTAAASTLDNSIKNEEAWKWASESKLTTQKFREAQVKLLRYMKENTYASDFCLLSTQELKKKNTDGDSQIGQGSMVKELDMTLDDLNREVARLIAMQNGKTK